MNRKRLQPVNNPEEVPEGLSDEEQVRFWETHEVTEKFLAGAEMASEDERPRPRTKPINVRFDNSTLTRLNALAAHRDVGYQTLLKQFVTERLYEEEKREGLLPVGGAVETESTREPPETADKREMVKPRDWQS